MRLEDLTKTGQYRDGRKVSRFDCWVDFRHRSHPGALPDSRDSLSGDDLVDEAGDWIGEFGCHASDVGG